MKKITTLLFTNLVALLVFAQPEISENPPTFDVTQMTIKGSAVIGAFGEVVVFENTAAKPHALYKKPVEMAEDFSGYSIQVTTSMEKLSLNHPVRMAFGTLMVEENANPRYAYLVGQFKTRNGAEKYLENVINSRFPEAQVVRYKKGRRTKLK